MSKKVEAKIDKTNKHYKKWRFQAVLGLILICAGLCCTLEASDQKHNDAPTLLWVAYGTVSLAIFCLGLSVFGNAILERVRYEKEA